MMTAEAQTENVIDAKKAGVNNYIVKPFDAETLKTKMEAVFPNAMRVHPPFKHTVASSRAPHSVIPRRGRRQRHPNAASLARNLSRREVFPGPDGLHREGRGAVPRTTTSGSISPPDNVELRIVAGTGGTPHVYV